MSLLYNCVPCNYKSTKKHIYEKHINSIKHIEKVNKETTFACVCGKEYKIKKYLLNHKKKCNIPVVNNTLYNKATNDFYKYVYDADADADAAINNNHTNKKVDTQLVDDGEINTVYSSTTNTITDYDVHIDTRDFINMMNTSLATLKQNGDKKTFVNNFFEYMFRHITEIRHTNNNSNNE